MKHVLLELLCAYEPQKGEIPEFCRWGPRREGTHCMMGDLKGICPFLRLTYAPDEIAYADSDGNVARFTDQVGFGGCMEDVEGKSEEELLAIWAQVCRQAVSDALRRYYDTVGKPFPEDAGDDDSDWPE